MTEDEFVALYQPYRDVTFLDFDSDYTFGVFCGLVSYSAKLRGQSPDVFLPIVTTIVYGLIAGLPFGWPWPHGTFIGPFNIYLTHTPLLWQPIEHTTISYYDLSNNCVRKNSFR